MGSNLPCIRERIESYIGRATRSYTTLATKAQYEHSVAKRRLFVRQFVRQFVHVSPLRIVLTDLHNMTVRMHTEY